MELDPQKIYEIGQAMMDKIRDEAVISTLDGLIVAAEGSPKHVITLDELKYTRSIIKGETDQDLQSAVRDQQVQELLDEMHKSS